MKQDLEAMTVLWAVRIGDEDWQEQIITTNKDRIADARKWAEAQGFNRFRIAESDGKAPDFRTTINTR